MKKLILENLEQDIGGIEKHFGGFMKACASFRFMDESHNSGVVLSVTTDNSPETFEVYWNIAMSDDLKNSMNDPQRTTDFAAMGMAVLLVLELTEFDSFITSRKGTGVDFWLSKSDSNDLDFSNSARLEISGLQYETETNKVEYRITQKKKQSDKSKGSGLKAYIAVTEFRTPKSGFMTK